MRRGVCESIQHATHCSKTTMTNDTETNGTDSDKQTKTIVVRSLTDEDEQILNETITQLQEINPDIDSETITLTTNDWSWDGPCPKCGGKIFHEIRGRQEESQYNHETRTVDYIGLSTDTAIVQTDIIAVICENCSEVLYETLEHHTLSYQIV